MKRPVAVFDSGVGGLTVVKALKKILPSEQIVYFGDTARVPYGTRSRAVIRQYAAQITEFLSRFDPKVVVTACHTVSSLALPFLAQRFPKIPFIDVVTPSMEKALAITRGKIGVIGTPATVASGRYEELGANFPVTIHLAACPLFVPLVEEGWLRGPVPEQVAEHYLRPLLAKGIDTLILGCTHYPLLKQVIKRVAGPSVRLIDASEETGNRVKEFLGRNRLTEKYARTPAPILCFSDLPPYYRNVLAIFWKGDHVKVKQCGLENFEQKKHPRHIRT